MTRNSDIKCAYLLKFYLPRLEIFIIFTIYLCVTIYREIFYRTNLCVISEMVFVKISAICSIALKIIFRNSEFPKYRGSFGYLAEEKANLDFMFWFLCILLPPTVFVSYVLFMVTNLTYLPYDFMENSKFEIFFHFFHNFIYLLSVLAVCIPPAFFTIYCGRITLELKKMRNTLRILDNNNQKIRRQLIKIIQQYEILKNNINHLTTILIYAVIMLFLSGVLVLAFNFVIILKGGPILHQLKAGMQIIVGSYIFLQCCLAGQILETESIKLYYDVYDVKWYHWNEENKKIIKLILLMMEDPLCFNVFRLITVDFTMVLSMYKKVASTVSFYLAMEQVR